MHFYDKRLINCDIKPDHSGDFMGGSNMQNRSKISKINFYTPTNVGKKTKCMLMMSTKPSFKIFKFMAPYSGVKVLRRGQCCQIKMFLKMF